MSTLIVEITRVLAVKPHPNADRLDLITVKGWQVVAEKGKYKEGDLVVYCPIDAVLPIELSDKMNITNYLSKGRVRTVKLRGEYSQGLIIPLSMLNRPEEGDNFVCQYIEGEDVKDALGITKYEPIIPIHMAGKVDKYHPLFTKYTDIENIKNFPNVLQEGEEVVLTEKIHGTNFRVGLVNGELMVGSKNWGLKEDETNLYWIITHKFPQIEVALRNFYKDCAEVGQETPPNFILYGEIYGGGVQKGMDYGLKEPVVRFFDVKAGNMYLDYYKAALWLKINNLEAVPLLYKGPWHWEDLKYLANGSSKIGPHIKEGFVVKPTHEREERGLGRVILKHISEDYLMKDYGDLQ